MRKYRGVFERDGAWWIEYWSADRKRHREKAGTLGAAKKLVELRRTQRLEGKLPKPRTRLVLFGELTAAAIEYSERGKKGTNTSRMRLLVEKFGNQPAEEITPDEIKQWLQEHTEWSLATKNRYIALLKLVYRLAEEAQKIQRNPARLVRQAKENNARVRWLTDAEEAKLRGVLQSTCHDHLPEFEIALGTGMRRSGQYGMTWENVDFENGVIKIPRAKHGEVRWVRMNSRVKSIVSMLRDQAQSEGRVHQLKSPRCWFEPAVKASKLSDFHWHDLRHTFISRLVMAGVDLRTAQELAGHKSISMTCRYAHLSQGHQQAAVEKLVATATTTATEPNVVHGERAAVVQ